MEPVGPGALLQAVSCPDCASTLCTMRRRVVRSLSSGSELSIGNHVSLSFLKPLIRTVAGSLSSRIRPRRTSIKGMFPAGALWKIKRIRKSKKSDRGSWSEISVFQGQQH